MNYAIDVQNLTVAYDNRVVLSNVSWQVRVGSLAAVIGPNGGGKSTLLKSLLNLVSPAAGTVKIFNQNPKQARPRVAYLSQADEVDWEFPISCFDVVLHGRLVHLNWWQRPSRQDRDAAYQSLKLVGMEELANRPIGNLSGGQKQRIFIARALAQQADLIIMDEPAAALDAAAQHQLLDLFFKLQQMEHTVVIATHDLNCLAAGFDSVLGLNQEVILAGTPGEVLNGESLTKLFAKHFPVIGPEGEVAMHDFSVDN